MNLLAESLDCHFDRVKESIRDQPQTTAHRFALASLMALRGDYDHALQQVQTLALLDKEFVLTAQMLRMLIRAERIRERTFAGTCRPLILGQPESWLGVYLEALAESPARAAELRHGVVDELPALRGYADSNEFAWICDGDSRLGPCFEIVLDGEYYWLPANQVTRIDFTPPTVALDLVWAPIGITLANGGSHAAYMPVRYPANPAVAGDDAILLGHRTEWDQVAADTWHGRGRRTWIANGDDIPMFSAQTLVFGGKPDRHPLNG
jgi:type VI secretion system protein ImpE